MKFEIRFPFGISQTVIDDALVGPEHPKMESVSRPPR